MLPSVDAKNVVGARHARGRLRATHVAVAVCFSLLASAALVDGCSAAPANHGSRGGAGGTNGSAGGASGGSQHGSSASGSGGNLFNPDSGPDTGGDVVSNPCGTQCGTKELCDPAHLGLDDNCNGDVDEGCPCEPGQAHFCFKGDPSYRGTAGCHDGTETCSESGSWGPCIGGVHAVPPDNCQNGPPMGCHAITATPFQSVALKSGAGTFSLNADVGSESWTVACPAAISPCPGVGPTPPDAFVPLQSGEYTVTYDKKVSGAPKSCTYPLIVGAPGLRVELNWEHPDDHTVASPNVDLDLHMKQPLDTHNWSVTGATNDCGYGNCKEVDFQSVLPTIPSWFANAGSPPTPLNWYDDPDPKKNTCYFAPAGEGMLWNTLAEGCHNPRLDVDDFGCANDETDTTSTNFCTPENINVDFPPTKEWIRVGVHYYSARGHTYDVHPIVRIFCGGSEAAELGSIGYNTPQSPVTFVAADGTSPSGEGNKFWVVADVRYEQASQCGPAQCTVMPVYASPANKTPYFETVSGGAMGFGPAYPPP